MDKYYIFVELFCILSSLGVKYSAFENGGDLKMGVTEYAGSQDNVKTDLKRCLMNVFSVFRLPLFSLVSRQSSMHHLLVDSSFNELGLALTVGENFHSSSHTGHFNSHDCKWFFLYVHLDNDMAFTFSGSFSNSKEREGNGNAFVFPTFDAKIVFTDEMSLFCFNPKFLHCAEMGVFSEGESCILFREDYLSLTVYFMRLMQFNWPGI